MQLVVDGKIVSSLVPGRLSTRTVRVTSMKYTSFAGFSAPLNLLVLNVDESNFRDEGFTSATSKVYFYIEDQKLTQILDVQDSISGTGFYGTAVVLMPDRERKRDTVTVRYSGGLVPRGEVSEEQYTWDWDKKTFVKAN
jgi:hypothetical protein